jgi:hypothetical protein
MAKWLENEVEWDEVYTEENGVGAVGEFLHELIPQATPVNVNAGWITDKARKLHAASVEGQLTYNDKDPLAPIFVKEVGACKYTMTSNKNISLPHSGQEGHSDFISSLMLCLNESGTAYL